MVFEFNLTLTLEYFSHSDGLIHTEINFSFSSAYFVKNLCSIGAVSKRFFLPCVNWDNPEAAVFHIPSPKSAKIGDSPVDKNLQLSTVVAHQNDIRVNEVERKSGYGGDSVGELVLSTAAYKDPFLEPVIANPNIELPPEITNLIDSTRKGLDRGHLRPLRCTEGSGGVYFMWDESGSKYISVFKPEDEEPYAVNNPQGWVLSPSGEGLKKGIRVGEGAVRECAAYVLDHAHHSLSGATSSGFAGVPPTVYVRCLHEAFNHPGGIVSVKTGSLQKFEENIGNCADNGPRNFPVEMVHKIAVFDMRMANADRHGGNILLRKGEDGQIKLIPIDHGYCLPYSFEDCTFEWLNWRQSSQPFSNDIIEYIRSLDAEKDIELLKLNGWDPPLESIRVLRISTMLLKKGTEKRLNPYDIGSIMCRETDSKPSIIEDIVREAHDSVPPGSTEAAFLDAVSAIMDRRLQ